jgi:thioredoxin-related protein
MIATSEYALILFTIRDCAYCRTVDQEFEAASKMISIGSPGNPDVICVHVDMENETDFAHAQGLEGYPILRFYINGTYVGYEGEFK